MSADPPAATSTEPAEEPVKAIRWIILERSEHRAAVAHVRTTADIAVAAFDVVERCAA
jgi:hypothetical protein